MKKLFKLGRRRWWRLALGIPGLVAGLVLGLVGLVLMTVGEWLYESVDGGLESLGDWMNQPRK